ncbi:hypothetical protein [Candidatus Mesenet endosymbiont of Phosphuga atrata]|uniref:hypothetical protein n=1 Tax=Candidatus Mesenet endosymbiont of Phosphuga atrata TaxID=3066221 RepID=UPI0030D1A95C
MPTKNINFQDSEEYLAIERMKKGKSSFKIVHDDVSGTYFDVNYWNVTLKDIKEFFELNKINDANSLLTNGSGLTLFMLICMHVSRA